MSFASFWYLPRTWSSWQNRIYWPNRQRTICLNWLRLTGLCINSEASAPYHQRCSEFFAFLFLLLPPCYYPLFLVFIRKFATQVFSKLEMKVWFPSFCILFWSSHKYRSMKTAKWNLLLTFWWEEKWTWFSFSLNSTSKVFFFDLLVVLEPYFDLKILTVIDFVFDRKLCWNWIYTTASTDQKPWRQLLAFQVLYIYSFSFLFWLCLLLTNLGIERSFTSSK